MCYVSCNHLYITIATNRHHHHHLNNFGDGVIIHCKQQAITIAICDFFGAFQIHCDAIIVHCS